MLFRSARYPLTPNTGSLLSTAFALSLATHLSLYPILLLPPLFLLLRRRNPSLLLLPAFIAHQTITLGLSAYLTQSWDFLGSFYGVMFAPFAPSTRQS